MKLFRLALVLGTFETYIRFFKNLLKIDAQTEENELEDGDIVEPEAAKHHRTIVDYYEV